MEKTVLITGATAGFGEACARTFAKENWRLIITGRRGDRLTKLQNELEALYQSEVHCLNFDVRNEKEVNNAIEQLQPEWKNIDVLINNAGLAVGKGAFDEGLSDDWNRMIDTNVKGLMYVTKALLPYLKNSSAAHIVNIGSIAGKEVYPGGNVYCASKHAVDALTKAMRIDLLPYGIKVSQIAPGAAETEFSLVRFKGDEEKAKSVYQGFEALKAEDIAETVWFVVSRPDHVCLNDIIIMPKAQANSSTLLKK
ncbi:MAG: SDR family oxidoreductase [Flavobacteriales bacterium]|nr:SDR family oxidoreductase [Flavobacteriales bacterium]MDG1765517.1 SDR family oxidoreductase [Flavobacteriales bacterium]